MCYFPRVRILSHCPSQSDLLRNPPTDPPPAHQRLQLSPLSQALQNARPAGNPRGASHRPGPLRLRGVRQAFSATRRNAQPRATARPGPRLHLSHVRQKFCARRLPPHTSQDAQPTRAGCERSQRAAAAPAADRSDRYDDGKQGGGQGGGERRPSGPGGRVRVDRGEFGLVEYLHHIADQKISEYFFM